MLHGDFIHDREMYIPKKDRIDIQVFKEWIETNDNQLIIIDNLYKEIKKFILHDLSPEQVRVLSKYKINRKFGNSKIEYVQLSDKYLNRYKKCDDYYEFQIKTSFDQLKYLPIRISTVRQDMCAAYDDGIGSKDKALYLFCIENEFDLNTIKDILDSKFDIVHELTHFIDDMNSNGKALQQHNKEYYKDDNEIHAFIQTMLSWLKEYLDSFEGMNKFYKIKKKDLTPDKIKDIINQYLNNPNNDNPIFFYTVRDYNRMILQKHFEQMDEKTKRKIYSKLSEELQSIIKEDVIDFNTLTSLQESLPL